MVLPKQEGGLGIREARVNNEAMLAKVGWKTTNREKSIWMELIYAKYLKDQSILHYSAKPGDSPVWKEIIKCAQNLNSIFHGE